MASFRGQPLFFFGLGYASGIPKGKLLEAALGGENITGNHLVMPPA